MMRSIFMFLFIIISTASSYAPADWGFYGHRTINKMAVFSLPPEMIGFFKSNINYISDHAVDPDKRRYATKHEGVRHYIDIDIWDEYPFNKVPRRFDDALIKYAKYKSIMGNDTTEIMLELSKEEVVLNSRNIEKKVTIDSFRNFWHQVVMPQYYEEEWIVSNETTSVFDVFDADQILIEDHFSQDGILPYYLLTMKNKLTRAFKEKNKESILRLSAEIGHYIGDAHVPLHTTVNYNGQLTNQVGIHAFWESRIPELFAEKEYDFLVGRAHYINYPSSYFWDIVLKSHSYLDEVLDIEKELSKTFPEDEQYCYDERLTRTIRIQCPEYAKAYQIAMQGMVEERFTSSILSISSVWYTCWVDAGMPPLDDFSKIELEEIPVVSNPKIEATARPHE